MNSSRASWVCQVPRCRCVLARAFADYNDDRIHSALEYVTPNEFAREAEDGNK